MILYPTAFLIPLCSQHSTFFLSCLSLHVNLFNLLFLFLLSFSTRRILLDTYQLHSILFSVVLKIKINFKVFGTQSLFIYPSCVRCSALFVLCIKKRERRSIFEPNEDVLSSTKISPVYCFSNYLHNTIFISNLN